MDNEHIFYPEFSYPALHLSAFTLCIDVFIISLKNGEIVRFKPNEIAHFKEWLNRFKVRDITVNDGIPHTDRTSNLSKPTHGFFNLIKRSKRK
ncbi:MAG: hypothetical protein JSS67_12735 [Bacteroidetes bacterium]|uniref:Uncharacterized protein n=1 Tax=Chryseobacterium taihuense TaxID=1141221 RepID=A0ABY0QPE2_9FLAO|nr:MULTISPECIES: hypothetical protein [Weeksellaceae]MBS1731625.1 hypothetical protein [Bacteroidota bacterium]ASE60482.1 hypothetical protein CEQ15_02640 [Chryseobacterium indologenes]MBE9394079.1 hypothetical protein [Elizabethkingia anophelis]MBE9408521.1 hypothetical protein [Elizabethkingia anophelis]SDL43420.1 hypothetical protein SAMN05216273_101146 [Chryseobacterium taihuense]